MGLKHNQKRHLDKDLPKDLANKYKYKGKYKRKNKKKYKYKYKYRKKLKMAQLPDEISNYLLNLTEQTLFERFTNHKRFRKMVRRSEDPMDSIDWYLPSEDLYIEGKCREYTGQSYLIEEKKYNSLIVHPNCWYVSSGGNGIFAWDLQEYIKKNKMYFNQHIYPKTSKFEDNKNIKKSCDYLPIDEAIYLTAELLLFPFDKNHLK
jgi:hypothetical protein